MNTPQGTTASPLDDLDSLLSESVKIAEAKRQAKRGAKLNSEQIDILEANKLAEEIQLWQDIRIYAHMTETLCDCGNCFKDFKGWYKLQQRKGKTASRLMLTEKPAEGLELKQYLTYELASYCYECVEESFPTAYSEECALLSSLGSEEKLWYEPAEDTGDLLLEIEGELINERES